MHQDHGAACLPERKILAFAVNGAALGGSGDAGSREGLSPAQGPQAVAALEGRARQAKGAGNFREPASCPSGKGCVDSKSATPASGFSTSSGTSPLPAVFDIRVEFEGSPDYWVEKVTESLRGQEQFKNAPTTFS